MGSFTMTQESALAGKGGTLKTSNAAWGNTYLSLTHPIGISIPLDDRGTASAEGNASGLSPAHIRPAQVKRTCRLADLCGRVGLPVKKPTLGNGDALACMTTQHGPCGGRKSPVTGAA